MRKISRETRSHRRSGFSLIELLIALGVFAFAMVLISQTFFNILSALQRHEQQKQNINDLRFVRSQALLEADLDTFEDGGEIETLDSGRARWEADVEPTELPHFFRVQLRVMFSGSERTAAWEHAETLYLLRPTWSEAADSSELMARVRERIEDGRNFWDW